MGRRTEPTGPMRAKKWPRDCSVTCGGRFATKTLVVWYAERYQRNARYEVGLGERPLDRHGPCYHFALRRLWNLVRLRTVLRDCETRTCDSSDRPSSVGCDGG